MVRTRAVLDAVLSLLAALLSTQSEETKSFIRQLDADPSAQLISRL
jgi:hypothetical protein